MATVQDVARRARVSTSTVSHVVNETRPVSDELRARVEAAMQELGYEPNAVARSLKVRRSNTIGLVISDISNPFFTDVVRAVEDAAQQNGYLVILCDTDEDPAKEAEYLRVLSSRQVDGLILAPAGERHEYLARLARRGFPLVFLDREIPDLGVSAVMLDNQAAARDAVRHLINLGHSRIALVAGRPRISSTQERLAGYRAALLEAGLPYDETMVGFGESRTEEARLVTGLLLDSDPPPTAFVVANNLMTIGAVAALKGRGLDIPSDVALVGFDDFSWANVFRPRLTTIAQPIYELGRTAADLLVGQIQSGGAGVPRRIRLPGRLVIRESCGSEDLEEPLTLASAR